MTDQEEGEPPVSQRRRPKREKVFFLSYDRAVDPKIWKNCLPWDGVGLLPMPADVGSGPGKRGEGHMYDLHIISTHAHAQTLTPTTYTYTWKTLMYVPLFCQLCIFERIAAGLKADVEVGLLYSFTDIARRGCMSCGMLAIL